MSYFANLLTLLSLAFGFASVIFSFEQRFVFAAWLIILSVILDGLDGQISRMKPSPSEFGKQLDSLVDVVSFGIAPAMLSYVFGWRHFYLRATLTLFIYLFCGVIRLARYNITPKEKLITYFYGLPITISGGMLAAFILISKKYSRFSSPFIFILIILFLAFLMVSRVKYLNLDGLKQVLGKKILPMLSVVLIAVIFFPEITIFALFLIYLLFSPFMVKLLKSNVVL